jgi:hypothetical protein
MGWPQAEIVAMLLHTALGILILALELTLIMLVAPKMPT